MNLPTHVELLIQNYLSLDRLITVKDNYVLVHFRLFTDRNYVNNGVHQLIDILLSFENKIFIFIIDDGINYRFTAIKYIIEYIVEVHSLNESNCFIYSWENLSIPNTTFIPNDLLRFWCRNVFNKADMLPPVKNNYNKKFAALFGRHNIYRLKILRYLLENYKNDSLLSYTSCEQIWGYDENTYEFYSDDLKWYKENCPILLDFDKPHPTINWEKSIDNIHKHYNSYFIEIVCETDPYSIFLTEKTVKNFYIGKPFILLSGTGSLSYLKDRGFRTFDKWIDESYDSMPNIHFRLAHIKKEIDRISKFSLDELEKIQIEMNETHQLNREKFLEICL